MIFSIKETKTFSRITTEVALTSGLEDTSYQLRFKPNPCENWTCLNGIDRDDLVNLRGQISSLLGLSLDGAT